MLKLIRVVFALNYNIYKCVIFGINFVYKILHN